MIKCDFDACFLGKEAMSTLQSYGCNVRASPPNRKSQNGLVVVEQCWQILEGMTRVFLTKACFPTKFW